MKRGPIKERESRTLEYKREVSNLRKIAQTVVAFANGGGGEIIIGVEDKSLKVVGVPPVEVDSLLERLPISLADQISPPLVPLVYSKTIQKKEVLIVQVFPGTQRPYFVSHDGIERGVYIRIGAHTRRAEGEMLEELRLYRMHLTYDEAPILGCTRSELDLRLLPSSLRTEKALFSLDILRRDERTGEAFPTRGAVLMLSDHPEKYVPEAEIIISKMRGTEGRNTVESHVLNGNVPTQAEQALDHLIRWLGKEPELKKGRYLTRECRLPLVAMREALHNALFHRQYNIAGAVKIALYADRLEIFSPGHFAGPFVPSALGDGTSYVRNRVMCVLARRLGLMEKRGTGIKAILDSMETEGLFPPEFKEGQNWFKVTLRLTKRNDLPDKKSDKTVLELFEFKATISSADVCKALGVSKATAVARIEALIQSGQLQKIGAGPKTRYKLRK